MKQIMVKEIIILGLIVSLGLSLFSQHVTSQNESQLLAPPSGEYWWPMFRNDPGNTGYTTSKAPDKNEIWTVRDINEPVKYSSPVIVDHRLYIGTSKTDRSYLLCIDIDTQELIWTYEVPGTIESSPAVASGKIFFTFNHNTDEAMLVCLYAESGEKIWQQPIENIVVCSPIAFFEKIYICTIYKPASVSYGEVWCFDYNGNIIWKNRMDAGKVIPWYSAPAGYFTIYNKYLLVPLVREGDYAAGLIAFNAENGSLIWERYLQFFSDIVAPSPVIFGGKAFITRMDDSDKLIVNRVEITSGDYDWTRILNAGEIMYTASPAVDNQNVYVITQNKAQTKSHVYSLNSGTGNIIWDKLYNGLAYSCPAVAAGKLYFTVGGVIYCLDTVNGNMIWDFNTHEEIYSSPAIASHRLFVVTFSGNILTFGNLPQIGAITGGFLSAKSEIRNQGSDNLTDLNYKITAKGGILHLIDRTTSANIDLLEVNTAKSIKVSPLFGLGNIHIEIIVTTSDLITIRRTRDGTILGPFVIFK